YGSLQQQQQVCRLHPTPDGVYTAILALDSNSALRQGDSSADSLPGNTYQVLEATLKVMWDRNFHTYPDIIVDIECRVPESGAGSEVGLPVGDPRWPVSHRVPDTELHIQASSICFCTLRKSEDSPLLSRGPLSGLSLDLRVLNEWNRMIGEADENEIIKLDILLHDRTGAKGDREYTGLLIRQCFAANKSAASADDGRPSRRGANGRSDKLIIGCGGDRVLDSGFTADFRSTRPKGGLHMQTGGFPAFRLGNSPNLYFRCTVRVCRHSDEKLCEPTSCASDKMAKRSPDSSVWDIETESHVVVALKRDQKWAQPQSSCQASMCLSTRQVIVIILILLVLLALVSGLVIVVYRRRLLISAQRRLRRVSSSQDGGPSSSAAIAASAACRGGGAIGGVIGGSEEDNDLDDLDEDVVGTPQHRGGDAAGAAAKTIVDYPGSPPSRQQLARLAAYSTVSGSMLASHSPVCRKNATQALSTEAAAAAQRSRTMSSARIRQSRQRRRSQSRQSAAAQLASARVRRQASVSRVKDRPGPNLCRPVRRCSMPLSRSLALNSSSICRGTDSSTCLLLSGELAPADSGRDGPPGAAADHAGEQAVEMAAAQAVSAGPDAGQVAVYDGAPQPAVAESEVRRQLVVEAVPVGADVRQVVNLAAPAQLHDQHPLADQAGHRARNLQPGEAAAVQPPGQSHVLGLGGEVQLARQIPSGLVDQPLKSTNRRDTRPTSQSMVAMSAADLASTSGCCTFTATGVPSSSSARCTCARLAAPHGRRVAVQAAQHPGVGLRQQVIKCGQVLPDFDEAAAVDAAQPVQPVGRALVHLGDDGRVFRTLATGGCGEGAEWIVRFCLGGISRLLMTLRVGVRLRRCGHRLPQTAQQPQQQAGVDQRLAGHHQHDQMLRVERAQAGRSGRAVAAADGAKRRGEAEHSGEAGCDCGNLSGDCQAHIGSELPAVVLLGGRLNQENIAVQLYGSQNSVAMQKQTQNKSGRLCRKRRKQQQLLQHRPPPSVSSASFNLSNLSLLGLNRILKACCRPGSSGTVGDEYSPLLSAPLESLSVELCLRNAENPAQRDLHQVLIDESGSQHADSSNRAVSELVGGVAVQLVNSFDQVLQYSLAIVALQLGPLKQVSSQLLNQRQDNLLLQIGRPEQSLLSGNGLGLFTHLSYEFVETGAESGVKLQRSAHLHTLSSGFANSIDGAFRSNKLSDIFLDGGIRSRHLPVHLVADLLLQPVKRSQRSLPDTGQASKASWAAWPATWRWSSASCCDCSLEASASWRRSPTAEPIADAAADDAADATAAVSAEFDDAIFVTGDFFGAELGRSPAPPLSAAAATAAAAKSASCDTSASSSAGSASSTSAAASAAAEAATAAAATSRLPTTELPTGDASPVTMVTVELSTAVPARPKPPLPAALLPDANSRSTSVELPRLRGVAAADAGPDEAAAAGEDGAAPEANDGAKVMKSQRLTVCRCRVWADSPLPIAPVEASAAVDLAGLSEAMEKSMHGSAMTNSVRQVSAGPPPASVEENSAT
uniref:ZP domain-containing protein n=1 Tax=Macrostomum lignano TaxID=282301 RepID=A0A1I8ITV2_9PLAT